MDPFSAEGELVHMHNAFHQNQYQQVVDFDTSSFSSANALPARILKLRAKVAIGEAAAVAKELASQNSPIDLVAVRTLAESVAEGPEAEGPKNKALELSQSHGDNLSVQLCAGTVLANAGLREEAVNLLSKHQGSLDAVALLTQIHLSANRLDLAASTVKQAKQWAQDSLLINIAESWVNLRTGGQENYQSAFYVYEELATAPSTSSASTILGQAVSELHLGRLPEAEAAAGTAIERAESDTSEQARLGDVYADAVVLYTVLGREAEKEATLQKLQKVDASHPLLLELEKKREAFSAALEKWNPKFEVEA